MVVQNVTFIVLIESQYDTEWKGCSFHRVYSFRGILKLNLYQLAVAYEIFGDFAHLHLAMFQCTPKSQATGPFQ